MKRPDHNSAIAAVCNDLAGRTTRHTDALRSVIKHTKGTPR